MQLEELVLFAFTTFIAAFYPVILLMASDTDPNPPYPNYFIT